MSNLTTRILGLFLSSFFAWISITAQAESSTPREIDLTPWGQLITDERLQESWHRQVDQVHRWETAWNALAAATEKELQPLIQTEIQRFSKQSNLTLDPWGSVDQESGFDPPRLTISYHEGAPIKDFGGKRTRQRIPPCYRLAQFLKLGENHLHLEIVYIDPIFGSDEGIGYEIQIRARNEIVATFIDAAKINTIETIRLSIDSYLPYPYLEIIVGPDAPLRKFRVNPPVPQYMKAAPKNRRWEQERTGDRLPDQAAEVYPSLELKRQQAAVVNQLRQDIRDRLDRIKVSLLQTLHSRIQENSELDASTALDSLRFWETDAPTLPGTHLWTPELILPRNSIATLNAALLQESPEAYIPLLTHNQIRLAKLALINGLRLRLTGQTKERATEQYLSLLASSTSVQ